jgi:hypothetical protein
MAKEEPTANLLKKVFNDYSVKLLLRECSFIKELRGCWQSITSSLFSLLSGRIKRPAKGQAINPFKYNNCGQILDAHHSYNKAHLNDASPISDR